MYDLWTIEVPGRFRDDVAYLDLETVKVPCAFTFPTGEKLGRRWSAFLAGVARNGEIRFVERDRDDELGFLDGVYETIGGESAYEVVYRATRKFDEMILRGRFTYARRGPAESPFYPALRDAEYLNWVCERPNPTCWWESERERELPSADVPATYYGLGRERDTGLVLIHLLRDVVGMIGAYGDPNETCAAWCRQVLTDREFAERVLFGPEEES
jgi:hypothetical protein